MSESQPVEEPKVFLGQQAERVKEVSDFLNQSIKDIPKNLMVFTFVFDTADPTINCKMIAPTIPEPDASEVKKCLQYAIDQWYGNNRENVIGKEI